MRRPPIHSICAQNEDESMQCKTHEDGIDVGWSDGCRVGVDVGTLVGIIVGRSVGDVVGSLDGADVGSDVLVRSKY